MSIEGIDFSAHEPGAPGGVACNEGNIQFVTTYLVGGDDWRAISRDEADDLRAHGVKIVGNVEADVRTWEGGYGFGVAHAQEGHHDWTRLGEDPRKGIYFSIDDDVDDADAPAIVDYFRGANSVIGLDRTWIYGGKKAVDIAWNAGVVSKIWQTYAWSGTSPDPWQRDIHPETAIYQYNIYGQYLNGVNVDLNRALKAEYGQTPVGAMPVPVPVPAPKPTFPIERVAAPDQFESQGHRILMNDSKRFFCIHGGHFHTGPSADAPTTPTPYAAGKIYTFGFRSNGTIGGARWLISRAGSWADAKNFQQVAAKG